jgi:hypothetical protein
VFYVRTTLLFENSGTLTSFPNTRQSTFTGLSESLPQVSKGMLIPLKTAKNLIFRFQYFAIGAMWVDTPSRGSLENLDFKVQLREAFPASRYLNRESHWDRK